MRGVKHLVVGVLLVVLALSAFVRAEACWVEEWKRDQPIIINSMLAAFSLFNVPEALQARYELFHTAYVDGRRITIVDQPLIPSTKLDESPPDRQVDQRGVREGPFDVYGE
jgi:hypothetical protein